MTNYSFTRLNTFDQCHCRYRFQYIERPDVPVPPNTVEAHMGSVVHEALERLYRDLLMEKHDTLEEALAAYNQIWQAEWDDAIVINRKEYTAENYRAVGERCVKDYYESHTPFEDMKILGVETNDFYRLPDGNTFSIRIDKLGCKGEDYYVCDYKTYDRMMDQAHADEDKQLAMYSKWVKDNYKDAKRVHLLWHLLRFGKDVQSERTDGQLDALVDGIVKKIAEIESCQEWNPTKNAYCDYCIYKCICPEFVHEELLKDKTVQEFKADDGVKIVDEYTDIKDQISVLTKRKEELEAAAGAYADQLKADALVGSKKILSVKPSRSVEYPDDRGPLFELLKQKGTYERYLQSSVDTRTLSKDILSGAAGQDVAALVKVTDKKSFRLSNRKDAAEEEK
jgi:putative RecB family exonuclease